MACAVLGERVLLEAATGEEVVELVAPAIADFSKGKSGFPVALALEVTGMISRMGLSAELNDDDDGVRSFEVLLGQEQLRSDEGGVYESSVGPTGLETADGNTEGVAL